MNKITKSLILVTSFIASCASSLSYEDDIRVYTYDEDAQCVRNDATTLGTYTSYEEARLTKIFCFVNKENGYISHSPIHEWPEDIKQGFTPCTAEEEELYVFNQCKD